MGLKQSLEGTSSKLIVVRAVYFLLHAIQLKRTRYYVIQHAIYDPLPQLSFVLSFIRRLIRITAVIVVPRTLVTSPHVRLSALCCTNALVHCRAYSAACVGARSLEQLLELGCEWLVLPFEQLLITLLVSGNLLEILGELLGPASPWTGRRG